MQVAKQHPLLKAFVMVACAFVLVASVCACQSKGDSGSIRIGTMPTEDILPMWVAEQEGYFADEGVSVEVIVFDSAQSLSAAITAGEVDIAMTDPMRAVKLVESGCPLSMEWVTLGVTAAQGRFGVLTSPDSGMASLADLVQGEKGVGLAANTVPEYVFDMLCRQQGIDPAKIKTNEVASLPDRYSLMAADQLDAAALPGSLLALGEASGMVLLADDASGANISQSVMVAREAYLADGGTETLDRVRSVWDRAASAINADPENYRLVLVEKANLNDLVATSYPISEYPMALTPEGGPAYPSAALIDPILDWMKAKGYAQKNIVYDPSDGSIRVG